MEVLELFFTLTWILLNTVKIQFSPRITFASSAISGHSGWVKGFSRSKRKVESVWQMQTTANTTEFVEALKAKVEANTRCWRGWDGPGGPTIYENGMKPKTIRKWKYRQCENCLLNVSKNAFKSTLAFSGFNEHEDFGRKSHRCEAANFEP